MTAHIHQPGLLQQAEDDGRAFGAGDVGSGVQLTIRALSGGIDSQPGEN